MVYPDLQFTQPPGRPFFYANFVTTVDGKVTVTPNPKAYWPLGSALDRATLMDLRAHADVLIHGKNTALAHRTADSVREPAFQARRQELGKLKPLYYLVIGSNLGPEIAPFLDTDSTMQPIAVVPEHARVDQSVSGVAQVVRLGQESVDLGQLSQFLAAAGHRIVLVEGGPTVFGEFLRADLIDELFVTVAPKLFGNAQQSTLTMVEGHLFGPTDYKHLTIISLKQEGNELFIRYRIER